MATVGLVELFIAAEAVILCTNSSEQRPHLETAPIDVGVFSAVSVPALDRAADSEALYPEPE
jgi:hypothetical protein